MDGCPDARGAMGIVHHLGSREGRSRPTVSRDIKSYTQTGRMGRLGSKAKIRVPQNWTSRSRVR